MARPAFILVGCGGVLNGRLTESLVLSESALHCDATEKCEVKLHEARNMKNHLGDITLIPFIANYTFGPALGSLLGVFTVVDDPTWILLLSYTLQEKAGYDCVLYVRIFHIPITAEPRRFSQALNSMILHHFAETDGNNMCHSLLSVEELFATTCNYSASAAKVSVRESLVSLRLTYDEVINLA
ncbi:hypothetical protein TraAM80_01703 [Trypanosoma rangeli]|uniref:Uncharacterized protein n=1 Tax=Trypanosoma rangeli TaxID=5698 RepID=A0A3R7M796_TRYRA|nr:uncharacterized protein TraAM80_01703 [Trypanosoma rangeli]RNF10343.1 hypothetical protein TraAM80_01703 [Trypanosoma rangeli]|eukprot:RNF10343.1 hypothetical protein TraAM80_01703 [Trypanosoma rangeli]